MRLDEDDDLWVGVDDYWFSRVISPSLLDAARGDRSLWADMAPRISKFDANAMVGARAWAAAERTSMLFQGTGSLGLPANTLVEVASALGPLIMDPPQDLGALYVSLARTGVGIAVDILGAIPIVGIIAQAIGGIGLFIWDVARMRQETAREYLPPPEVYDRNAEEYVMNTQLLPALSTNDWTGLFLPRMGNSRKILEVESGWLLDSIDGGQGLGFIPGTQQISSATQALWHKKSSRARGSFAVHQDIGDFYPGPAQLMTAIDQQVQRPGAEMWAVAPSLVRQAWKEHVLATMLLAYELFFGREIKGTGLDRLNEEHRRLIVRQLVAPLHVSYVNGEPRRGILGANSWSPKNAPDDIVEAFVEPWCERLAQRQDHYLGTTAVAYADPKSAAFAHDTKLRDKLFEMRKRLLRSPARYKVDPRDVIDRSYKTELFKSTVGSQLKPPDAGMWNEPAKIDGPDVEPEPPLPPKGGVPLSLRPKSVPQSPQSGGDELALAVGLFGLAWAVRRGLKRRR